MTKAEKLLKEEKCIKWVSLLAIALSFASIFPLLSVDGFNFPLSWYGVLLIYFCGVIFIYRWSKKFWSRVNNLLWEETDLENYYSFFAGYLPKNRPGTLNYYWGLIVYFRGQFEIAEMSLSKFQSKDLLPNGRAAMKQNIYVFRLLSSLAESDSEQFTALVKEAKQQEIVQVDAIEKMLSSYQVIENGQVVEAVPLLNDNHLYRILQTYYCAKNALNAGDVDQAREIFESIKDENPELFMVQEAREYLSEGQ